jgi:hypothetical protein
MQDSPSLRDLYPTLTKQELKEAETNLRRYAEIVLEVCQEQRSAAGSFDTSASSTTMKERSKVSLKN